MFRLELLVDDKKLAETLKAISGLCYDLKVQPVTFESDSSTAPTHPKDRSKGAQATAFILELIDSKRKHGVKNITAKEIKQAGVDAGFDLTIMNGATARAAMKGTVIKTEAKGVYLIPKGDN